MRKTAGKAIPLTRPADTHSMNGMVLYSVRAAGLGIRSERRARSDAPCHRTQFSALISSMVPNRMQLLQ